MNDKQKIELGRWMQDQPSYYSGDNKETDRKVFYIKAAESVLNKIQELNSEEFAEKLEKIDPKDYEVVHEKFQWPTDQPKFVTCVELLYKMVESEFPDFNTNLIAEDPDLALSKLQELIFNHENNAPEHKNAPSDNTEVGQYQTTGEKHHVCGNCYQSYPVKELERDFMDCDLCKESGKERPTCLDKNGKLFTAGDLLRNEKSLTTEVRILQIQPDTIIFNSTENLPKLRGCVPIQDFIDAGWIVHERVTPYEVGPTDFGTIKCRFKNFMIGDPGCIICDHCMGVNSEQQWVICELYNKENESNTGDSNGI